jgi:hypothetical protein
MTDNKYPTKRRAPSLYLSRQQEPAIIICRCTLCVFSHARRPGPSDLESEWADFFNCEAVNERICCQNILICLLLARNGTEIEEGETLIEGSEGIQVL